MERKSKKKENKRKQTRKHRKKRKQKQNKRKKKRRAILWRPSYTPWLFVVDSLSCNQGPVIKRAPKKNRRKQVYTCCILFFFRFFQVFPFLYVFCFSFFFLSCFLSFLYLVIFFSAVVCFSVLFSVFLPRLPSCTLSVTPYHCCCALTLTSTLAFAVVLACVSYNSNHCFVWYLPVYY